MRVVVPGSPGPDGPSDAVCRHAPHGEYAVDGVGHAACHGRGSRLPVVEVVVCRSRRMVGRDAVRRDRRPEVQVGRRQEPAQPSQHMAVGMAERIVEESRVHHRKVEFVINKRARGLCGVYDK